MNGLRDIATVLDSSARLIAARDTAEQLSTGGERARVIGGLVAALESVIRAASQRYVMANVPRARLADVRQVLPGINGPTVVDILNGGDHVAVHAVVPATDIYRVIGDLRAIGASGILVTRIERLVP
jgi:ATP phosphoribosyltransferase